MPDAQPMTTDRFEREVSILHDTLELNHENGGIDEALFMERMEALIRARKSERYAEARRCFQ